MENTLSKACAPLLVCILAFPIQSIGQKLWDGQASDGQWCNSTNWGILGNPGEDIQPGVDDGCNFTGAASTQTVIYVSCDTTVQRIQQRASAAGPRTIQIGTNEVVDRTLGLNGNPSASGTTNLLANQNTGIGRDLILSGAPNGNGNKLKLRIDQSRPIEVVSNESSITVSCDISGVGGFDKTGVGTLTLSGVNTYSDATTVSAGKLLVNSPGSLAAASAVTVNSSGTLGGSGTIGGAVTVAAGGALSPGASVGTLTLGGDLILSGDLLIEVNKSLAPVNDVISVAGALTNVGVGTVTVTNIGWMALRAGDRFQIFNKPLSNGQALTVASAGGVVWTNKLNADGSIAVVSAPPTVMATNLTIRAVGSTALLGGSGAPNSVYAILTSTNVTTPMVNWWLIGITNSDAGGVIQFLDPQATNDQRFYRFGQ